MNAIQLTVKEILDPNFLAAYDRLGEDPCVPMKSRFVLAHARKQILSALDTYEQQREKLVEDMGLPVAEAVAKRVALASGAEKERLQSQLTLLKETGAGGKQIDLTDAVAVKSFEAKLSELQGSQFPVPLTHKVVLTEQCRLSARDMASLLSLVDVK